MYPARELTRLAARKDGLLQDITLRRAQCAAAAGRLTRPVEWLDRAKASWLRRSPLEKCAAVPLGVLMLGVAFRRRRAVRALLRRVPLVLAVARLIDAAARTRGAPASAQPPTSSSRSLPA